MSVVFKSSLNKARFALFLGTLEVVTRRVMHPGLPRF